jgi:hypothetical protein
MSISYVSLLPCHGGSHNGFRPILNLDPFMIHETLLYLTETAFGSHPCRVVSATYLTLRPFHGGNTGSNPVGDANFQRSLRFGHDRVTIEPTKVLTFLPVLRLFFAFLLHAFVAAFEPLVANSLRSSGL